MGGKRLGGLECTANIGAMLVVGYRMGKRPTKAHLASASPVS